MNKKELDAFAKQAAKSIKTESDLTDFRKMLTKVTVEAVLNADLTSTWVIPAMSNPIKIITVTAIHLKLFVRKMVKSI